VPRLRRKIQLTYVIKISILILAFRFVVDATLVQLERVVAGINGHADDWAGECRLHQGLLVALLHRDVAGEVGLDRVLLLVAL
jgi:hypothetical protein